MARFADKTVVITGGNKGLGLAIATRFAAEGASLVIASVEDRIGLDPMPAWTPDTFHLKTGEMAGYIERVSWTAAKEPAEFSRTWYDAKRAVYISRMGKG